MCTACGMKWCEPCSEEYTWEPLSDEPHRAYKTFGTSEGPALWLCPTAGLVKFGAINWDSGLNVATGWTFVPYDKE